MRAKHKQEIEWIFDNSYGKLPSLFFTSIYPECVPKPELVIFNEKLAQELGLDKEALQSKQGIEILAGNKVPQGAFPLAMAYAGHQFGYFSKLGDGRAILLGEHITPDGKRIDIQLKGSGRTPFSRGGDGKAALAPMLREYIISEALYALGIPTTRSLAVVKTGEQIMRETVQIGAVLTRTASSHLRVGTFEYAAKYGSIDDLRSLADYAIERHYPDIKLDKNPFISLLEKVIDRQAKLVAKWNLVGFIHGVMNTDNVTISGETIDYGPCAFMDDYSINTVFSSIDHQGRYANSNQASITEWNMACFAESLLPIIHEDIAIATQEALKSISKFSPIYYSYWISGMCNKLGIFKAKELDDQLVNNLLKIMQMYKADYTNTFKALTMGKLEGVKLFESEEFKLWHIAWQKRLKEQQQSKEDATQLMKETNPSIIPRNYLVENALKDADIYGKIHTMEKLLEALNEPYGYTVQQEEYSKLPDKPDKEYRTYCGT